MENPKTILVLCTGNTARSQMAEGLLKNICRNKYKVFSAGTRPGSIRPEAVKVLAEINLDISGNRSRSIDEFTCMEIDFVLTVCDNAKENCPYFPAKTKLIHRPFEDPAGIEGDEEACLAAFRKVRDEIILFLPEFLKEIESLRKDQ